MDTLNSWYLDLTLNGVNGRGYRKIRKQAEVRRIYHYLISREARAYRTSMLNRLYANNRGVNV